MSQPLLNGEIVLPDETQELRDRITELEAERDEALQEVAAMKRSVAMLKRQVFPWKQAINGLWGELENFGDEPGAAPQADKSKWDFLGRKIGGKAPEIIEMLLAQREMTVTQLHKAVRCSYETARYTVRKMREAGIVTTNGSMVSLKQ